MPAIVSIGPRDRWPADRTVNRGAVTRVTGSDDLQVYLTVVMT